MSGHNYRPFAGFALAALMAGSAPAMAAPAWSTGQVTVEFADINLASPGGRQTLERRVEAAIRTMCGAPVFGTRDEAEALRDCRIEARTAVEPKVNSIVARAATTVAFSN